MIRFSVFWRFYGFKSWWKFFGWHGAFVLTIFFIIIGDFFWKYPQCKPEKRKQHLHYEWKIDKSNKRKYEGKKAHADDWTQTSSGLTAKFKFHSQVSYKQRHPHPLMQHSTKMKDIDLPSKISYLISILEKVFSWCFFLVQLKFSCLFCWKFLGGPKN